MKKVLITGATGGIGEAASRAFSAAGYFVVLHCHSQEEKAHVLAAELGNADVFRADLADERQVAALAEFCADADVLVNNAAVDLFGLFDLMNEQDLDRLYAVNLKAPLLLTRKLIKGMLSKGAGVILNVGSVFGEVGGSCEVDYSVTKAALIGLTKALAKEVGPAGVRVNCVCPGVIDTKMNDRLTVEEADALCEEIPLDRFGKAGEVADTLVFLASDRASYITGAVVDVNGGM